MILREKIIKLKVIKVDKDKIHFKIIEQSKTLRAQSGFEDWHDAPIDSSYYCSITSDAWPEVDESSNKLYIRGTYTIRDDIELSCSKPFFNKIENTLRDIINEKNELLY